MNLLRSNGRPLVDGHRGARAVAPENTLAALEAAVAAGADLVEFDVAPGLIVAHSTAETPGEELSLDAALEYLASVDIGVHVDVKLPGYEVAVVDAVRTHGLARRTLFSTALPPVSRTLAALAPDVPRAIGYPNDRLGVSRFAWPAAVTRPGAAALSAAMPLRIPVLLRQSRAGVLALHHTLCSRAAVAAAHRLGAPVFAWPVSDAAGAVRMASLGIDAIVSDDPETTLAALNPRLH
ncbi:MAG TPA: glycerophosphodiester phosphodiesterase [Gaiellaceae bacterium]